MTSLNRKRYLIPNYRFLRSHLEHGCQMHWCGSCVVFIVFAALFSGSGAFFAPNRVLALRSHHARDAARLTSTSSRRSFLPALRMSSTPPTTKSVVFGGGCFWCTEAVFKTLNGVKKVTSGYAGGTMDNPTYRDVCSGRTGHAEVVRVDYDPAAVTLDELLDVFWKSHDPTQGNRQGLDVGTEYRSIILCEDNEQLEVALASKEATQDKLNKEAIVGRVIGTVLGKREGENVVDVTTTVDMLPVFWEAEKVHQDYYARNPLSPYCVMNVGTKLVKLRPDIGKINRLTREREEQAGSP